MIDEKTLEKQEELEDNLKAQYIEIKKNKKLEKYSKESVEVIKINGDCLYDGNIHSVHFSGYMLLNKDGWFEGIVNDVINEEYYRYNNENNIQHSENKLIYGIYHENKYLELLKISPQGKVDPLALRAINIQSLNNFQKDNWVTEEIEENYDMIGPTRVIGFRECHFGYNYITFKKINLSKNNIDINELTNTIDKLKKEDLYSEVYDRMIAYKDELDDELQKIYENNKMSNMYIPASNQWRSNDEQAIRKVVDDEYMLGNEAIHKILKIRSLNYVKRNF